MTILRIALVVSASSLAVACVRAPNISVVDTRTALERQAAGEYPPLENDLRNAGVYPRGEEIPREQLAANKSGDETLGEVAQLFASAATDAEWVDQMLVEGCIGEAKSGLLQATPEQCKARVDEAERARILGRANLHRRQVWRYLAEQRPKASPEQVRAQWRTNHLARIVCNGLVQSDDESWKRKECDQ